jgi:hypothetical protein
MKVLQLFTERMALTPYVVRIKLYDLDFERPMNSTGYFPDFERPMNSTGYFPSFDVLQFW